MIVKENYQGSINELLGSLPNNPFVIDVVGKAIDIAAENTAEENDFRDKLAISLKMSKFAAENSPVNFFKYTLVVVPLLLNIPEEKYKVLDNTSGTIKEGVTVLTDFVNNTSVKKKWLSLNNMAKKNAELLLIAIHIMQSVIDEITKAMEEGELPLARRLVLTQIGFLENSLRFARINIPNNIYSEFNKLTASLIKLEY